MKIRKLLQLSSALVVSLSSLLVISMPLAHAAGPFSCTWTGGGSDDNFSTAANWDNSTCNGAAPQPADNDSLIFPFTAANFTPNNDLTNAHFNSINFNGAATAPYQIGGNSFTLAGAVSLSATSGEGFAVISNPITIGGAGVTMNSVGLTSFLEFDGAFSGSGNITMTGTAGSTGVFALGGDNSAYTGAIALGAGSLIAGDPNAFGTISAPGVTASANSDVTISCLVTDNFNGNLNLTGNSSLITGNMPTPKLGSGNDCSFSIGATEYGSPSNPDTNINLNGSLTLGSDITFAGDTATTTITGALSGAHSITMLPGYTGKLIVASSNNTSSTANATYTSAQVVQTLSDSQPATDIDIFGNNVITVDGARGNVTVQDGGILMGTGTIGLLFVGDGGTVAPGHSPGCLTMSGLSMITGGTYQAELGGTTACSGYDQLKVLTGGTIDITGATLSASLYNGFVPAVGNSFTVIDNQDAAAITGTFANLAEGATFVSQGVTYKITYVGGTGNDVVLTVVSINASQLPAKPNTGFTLVSAHPLASLITSTMVAVTLVGIARRMKPVSSSRK